MFAILMSMLIAAAPAPDSAQERLFEEAHGWRVFKTAEGCVGFFNQPTLSVSVFYPNNRDVLTLIIHHGEVPALSDKPQTIFLRAGKSQWGPAEGQAHRGEHGLPGVIFGVKRPKALAEFGRASEIAITKRFTPPRTVPLVAADKAADMLARCAG
ncbi:MAG: hypothetical protein ACAH11_00355 [Sphingomonas sp.]